MWLLRLLVTLWVFGTAPMLIVVAGMTGSGWALLGAVLAIWPWATQALVQVMSDREWIDPAGDILRAVGRRFYVQACWRLNPDKAPNVLVDRARAGWVGWTCPGHMVVRWDKTPEASTVTHELAHLRQMAWLGPVFLWAYLGASLVAWVTRSGAYQGNAFERAARRIAGES